MTETKARTRKSPKKAVEPPPPPPPAISIFFGNYRFLSNFFDCPVRVDGIRYQNSEAAFQAHKTQDVRIRKQFGLLTPSVAKSQGRRLPLRPDWDAVKDDIMRTVLRAKFDQNPDLKKLLVETYPRHLEEGNTWGDTYWGTVGGSGMNMLGKLLMELREFYVRGEA